MTDSESLGPTLVSLCLILCGREKGGNSKERYHSKYRGSEEGHTKVADMPHQKPSAMESHTWASCLQMLQTMSVSL